MNNNIHVYEQIYVWCHNHGIMAANMHELLTVLKLTYSEEVYLPSCTQFMSVVSTVRMPTRTLNLLALLRRPHPSMHVNSSCSNLSLQWWHQIYHQAMIKHRSRLSLRLRLSGLLSRPFETCSASCHSFKNASLWPPLFMHTALQIWPIMSLLNL